MDSVKPAAANSNVAGLVRSFAKALRFKAVGVAPDDGVKRLKFREEKAKSGPLTGHRSQPFADKDEDEKLRNRAALEAFLATLFASISSVKAAYAQLQIAQSPYDANGIQTADAVVVSELKHLSELKQCYLKKQIVPSSEVTPLLAEIQEQKNLLKTYEIMVKKFESQLKLKDSEITFLREKLEESDRQNRLIEWKLNPSGPLSVLDDLHLSGLNPNHFITVLRHVIKSIKSFVKLMIDQMGTAGWHIDEAASSIEPGVAYCKPEDRSCVFEYFVCREMFDGFHQPNFSLPVEPLSEKKQMQRHFFDKFTEMKSIRVKEFLSRNPNSTFGKFCRAKYLRLVHPKMEASFFGDLNQRNIVNSGGYPGTPFFATFAEMAKRVWFLHCLAFSFEPEASIFQVRKGSRFSEVYMESVNNDAFFSSSNPNVAFTVIPGFKIGKTVIQCQVYLSSA
ncbi:PREDICTED: IRK-interacting protein [Nelumbo nucifera]|uniref:IRK-interacting protein n=1 Tax=Nelumbo nucifera TaxID=4432 RepID=A0A1U7YW45_NELNU|nr:PREDICTED: IRK-interacting protein [Nelumbo nucifera]XP_010242146.1 PREDICTED: IRK-interacting protein [Nelumbo nucifera]XP_010242147.1 PREDICTED: IRK-interacting protein [Nelumbo nucifera]XP_010242148.1 PREDICTED: IRK-interacting protein [Nelumbo nucifera]XP_010242149.1 PREDICTED: IRK-interacting protein [Nelumbo nucifera]